MIRNFKHKGLERFCRNGDASGLNPQHIRRIRSILTALNAAAAAENMDLPGLQFHPLKGVRKGQWAVSVSGNWRIVFSFAERDAVDVDLLDYH